MPDPARPCKELYRLPRTLYAQPDGKSTACSIACGLGAIMGLFGWLFSHRDFCQHDFQPLFSRFVDTVVDTFVAEDPTAAPPRCHDKTPKRKQFKFPPAKRLVAIGDVHGDMSQMKRALRAAGLIDDNFCWSGGTLLPSRCVCSKTKMSLSLTL